MKIIILLLGFISVFYLPQAKAGWATECTAYGGNRVCHPAIPPQRGAWQYNLAHGPTVHSTEAATLQQLFDSYLPSQSTYIPVSSWHFNQIIQGPYTLTLGDIGSRLKGSPPIVDYQEKLGTLYVSGSNSPYHHVIDRFRTVSEFTCPSHLEFMQKDRNAPVLYSE